MARDTGGFACTVRHFGALIALLGSWLSLGCANPPYGGKPGAPDAPEMETWGKVDPQDLEYPENIGTFSLLRVEDFAEVELGVMLTYADTTYPRAVIDAYVYPITKAKGLSLTRVLEWEMSSVSQGMEHVARQKGLTAGEPAFFPFGPSIEDSPPGLGVVRKLSTQTEDSVSHGYVVVRDHRFFKLRVTIPSHDLGPDDEEYFQEVLDVLQPAIHLRPPVEMPGFGIVVYGNAFLPPQHEGCNIGGWIVYGAQMLKQIEVGNYRDTFARELDAREAVLNLWRKQRDKGETCSSDVLEAMSRADEAGFLAEYVFEAYGRGRWNVPDDLQLEEWSLWSKTHIETHDPVVDPGVAVEWRDGVKEADPYPEK